MLLNLLLPFIALGFGIIVGSAILTSVMLQRIHNVLSTISETIRELKRTTELFNHRISRIEKQIDKINNIK